MQRAPTPMEVSCVNVKQDFLETKQAVSILMSAIWGQMIVIQMQFALIILEGSAALAFAVTLEMGRFVLVGGFLFLSLVFVIDLVVLF